MPDFGSELAVELLDEFDIVRRGRAGKSLTMAEIAWVEQLPVTLPQLLERWRFRVVRPLLGGMLGVVFSGIHQPTDQPAVLKLSNPGMFTRAELRALQIANGEGAPAVYAVDESLGAVVMEHLGEPLRALNESPEVELQRCVQALQSIWRSSVDPERLLPISKTIVGGDEKLQDWWVKGDKPCSWHLVESALTTADDLLVRSARGHQCMLMGDPHPGNLLHANDGTWKWIDLAGFHGPREHDLGKMLALWSAGMCDHPNAIQTLSSYCSTLSSAASVDPATVWEWGFWLSTGKGLWLTGLGDVERGKRVLQIAAQMPTVSFHRA